MNAQDILIRLLKDGHITNDEFKCLWGSINFVNVVHPHVTLKPQWEEPHFIHLYDQNDGPFYNS